ncbi:hypothetical protein ABIF21_009036 [Bradyrhizobium elkanii]
MRSASSQINRVKSRSSEDACCSKSCAAPRMPDSGFLISWASIAASAITERAALRWVSCRSILSAMVRSCSITTICPGRSVSGATCRSTWRSPPIRGVPRSTLYSLTGEPLVRTCSISASSGLPNGTNSFSDCRRRNWVEISKNDSAAILASTIRPSGATSSTGLGSALRMASPSVGTGRRNSMADVMRQHSRQNRRRRRRASDARWTALLRSGSPAARPSMSRPARSYRPRQPPAPSRDACVHA